MKPYSLFMIFSKYNLLKSHRNFEINYLKSFIKKHSTPLAHFIFIELCFCLVYNKSNAKISFLNSEPFNLKHSSLYLIGHQDFFSKYPLSFPLAQFAIHYMRPFRNCWLTKLWSWLCHLCVLTLFFIVIKIRYSHDWSSLVESHRPNIWTFSS